MGHGGGDQVRAGRNTVQPELPDIVRAIQISRAGHPLPLPTHPALTQYLHERTGDRLPRVVRNSLVVAHGRGEPALPPAGRIAGSTGSPDAPDGCPLLVSRLSRLGTASGRIRKLNFVRNAS